MVFWDISERRRLETEREKALADYQMLFNKMLDGFALHEILCDPEGKPVDYRFLTVNPAFEKLTGLRSQVVVGRTVREILPSIDSFWIENPRVKEWYRRDEHALQAAEMLATAASLQHSLWQIGVQSAALLFPQ